MGSKSGEGGDVSAAAPCNAVKTEEQRERREQRFNQMASQTVLQKGRPAAGSASARDGRRGGGGERGQGQGEESKSRIRPPSLRPLSRSRPFAVFLNFFLRALWDPGGRKGSER